MFSIVRDIKNTPTTFIDVFVCSHAGFFKQNTFLSIREVLPRRQDKVIKHAKSTKEACRKRRLYSFHYNDLFFTYQTFLDGDLGFVDFVGFG
jgi:hypothetical protein